MNAAQETELCVFYESYEIFNKCITNK